MVNVSRIRYLCSCSISCGPHCSRQRYTLDLFSILLRKASIVHFKVQQGLKKNYSLAVVSSRSITCSFVKLTHCLHFHNDADQERLDYDTKKLQSFVKEKSFVISEKGALADRISPGIVKSLVSLTDKPK